MSDRDYTDYIKDIINSIDEIEEFTANMIFKSFVEDKKTVNAIIRSLEVLGEAAKKLPEEIRKKYPDVPWKRMAGMRDKLIHEYSGVDLEIIWKTIKEDIPSLEHSIKKMLKNLER